MVKTAQTRFLRRTEHLYYTAQMLFWLSVSLTAALGVLFMQARGRDLAEIGLLLGVYSLSVVIFEFPSGVLADRYGRKRVVLAAYALLLTSSLVFLFAFSFLAFLLFSVLNGAGRAFASGALSAWFIDRLQEADPVVDVQPPLARAATFELLALTAGTLLGGLLPTLFSALPADGTAVLTPLAVPVVASLGVKLALIVVVAVGVREVRPARDETLQAPAPLGRQLFSSARDALYTSRSRPVLRLLLLATAATGFALAGVETFWQPRFAALLGGGEGNTVLLGIIMAGGFLVGMAGNLASIPLCRLFGGRYGLVVALFQGGSGVALLLLAVQTAALPAAALFWLLYLQSGVVGSPVSALLNGEVSAAQRSTMLSAASLISYLGFFAGSALLGAVAEGAGIPLAWGLAGGVTLASLLCYLRVDARRNATEPLAP